MYPDTYDQTNDQPLLIVSLIMAYLISWSIYLHDLVYNFLIKYVVFVVWYSISAL